MDSFVNKVQRAGSRLKADGFGELSNDCFDAADYIERLEAVVRALDDAMRHATAEEIAAVLVVDRGRVWGNLVAARSRVTLSSPAALDNSVTDGHESTDKCGPDCTLEVLRPGQVQCNRDGANCPNREASNARS